MSPSSTRYSRRRRSPERERSRSGLKSFWRQAGHPDDRCGARLERSPERERLERKARLLAWGGIAYHFVEFAIAIGAGIAAGSIALIGFGADSLIEALAGFVVLWLFTGTRIGSEAAERRAQQLIAASFFVLAAYVGVESVRTLAGGQHPEASWIGIGLAAFTTVTMPMLARVKRRVGHQLGSSATVKEASQTQLCAYLSIALLIGLVMNAAARPLVG